MPSEPQSRRPGWREGAWVDFGGNAGRWAFPVLTARPAASAHPDGPKLRTEVLVNGEVDHLYLDHVEDLHRANGTDKVTAGVRFAGRLLLANYDLSADQLADVLWADDTPAEVRVAAYDRVYNLLLSPVEAAARILVAVAASIPLDPSAN